MMIKMMMVMMTMPKLVVMVVPHEMVALERVLILTEYTENDHKSGRCKMMCVNKWGYKHEAKQKSTQNPSQILTKSALFAG